MTEPAAADLDLALLALHHGIASISPPAKGPLIPFAVIEDAQGNRTLARFMGATIDEGIDQARETMRTRSDAMRVAIAFDGDLQVGRQRIDAVWAEVHTRGATNGYMFMQRFETGGFLRRVSAR